MATKTKPTKPAKSSSKNGRARTKPAGAGKFDAKQKPLDAMPDVDERIPALEEECQRYFAADDKVRNGRVQREESLEAVGKLLKKHELDCYIKHGRKFFFEPSREEVRVKKVKLQ